MGKTPLDASRRDERVILLALLLFALIFRLLTLMPIHSGVDERDYWSAAKALVEGTPYPELTHRTVRIAVIWPVALIQRLFGSEPNVYYVAPLLNALIQVALAYAIGLRLRGRATGILAALSLVLFPYMIRASSQVRPEIFSMTYILAALLCLLEYRRRNNRELPTLLFAAVWIFAAYESQITSLFFLPGMAIAIMIFKKRLSHALLFCAALFGLYLLETALYALFTDRPFGQIQVILGSHLADDVPGVTLHGFMDLFRRYARPYLQAYWQAPFAVFALAAVHYLRRKGEKDVKALVAVCASFFIFVTFAVKSLSPLVPAEDFINRYFCSVLGPVFLVLSAAATDALAAIRKKDWVPTLGLIAATLGFLAVFTAVLLALDPRPSYLREFGASPLRPREHPLLLNREYRKMVNDAFDGGMPIVAVNTNGGNNALSAGQVFFLAAAGSKDKEDPARQSFTGPDGLELVAWGRPVALKPPLDSVIAAVRNPYRLRHARVSELSVLTDTRFPGESGKGSSD